MAPSPARPAPDEYADFYGTYIAAVKEPLLDTLEAEAAEWRSLLASVPPDREGHRYAPGKWSVREVVGHVIDAERMLTGRAMAFARSDRSHFPSFDENAYAANSGADRRALADLTEELAVVRRATVLLLKASTSRPGAAGGWPAATSSRSGVWPGSLRAIPGITGGCWRNGIWGESAQGINEKSTILAAWRGASDRLSWDLTETPKENEMSDTAWVVGGGFASVVLCLIAFWRVDQDRDSTGSGSPADRVPDDARKRSGSPG